MDVSSIFCGVDSRRMDGTSIPLIEISLGTETYLVMGSDHRANKMA